MINFHGLLQRAGPLGAELGNRWNRTRAEMSGGKFIAHHGLQRAGTNYLLKALTDLGFKPLNAFNPSRKNPRHKHFRWQPAKHTIRPCMFFANTVQVETPEELDQTAGYPSGTHHIVIQKPPESWLPSVLNWGLRCGWWHDKHAALADAESMLQDYQDYHAFWTSMAKQAPYRIAIFDSEVLRRKPVLLPEKLEELGLPIPTKERASFAGVYTNLPHSPQGRQDAFDLEDRRSLAALAQSTKL